MLNTRKGMWVRVALLSLILGTASAPTWAGIVVVVGASNPVTSLTADQIKAIFLEKTKKFPNGSAVTPIDQKEGSAIYNQFAEQILNKNAVKLKAYWSAQIFSGSGNPPRAVDGDKAVKTEVSGSADAIGYIDSASVDQSVKAVFTVGN